MARVSHFFFAALTVLGIASAAVGQSASVGTVHDLSGSGVGGLSNEFYIPGGTIEINVTLSTSVTPLDVTALRYRLQLPAGLSYTGLSGANPPQLLPLGNTGTLDFIYTRVPDFPASFTVAVAVPADATGSYTLRGRANYGVGGGPLQQGPQAVDNLQRDTVRPVIALLGSSRITVGCKEGVLDPGVAATDNAEGDISGRVVITGAIDVNTPGSYTRYYNVSDRSGNAAVQRERTVVVLNNCPVPPGEGETPVDPCAGNCAGAPLTDSDGDGLTDCQETCIFGTLPNFADSDLDGMDDKFEIENSPPLNANRNDAAVDSDGDGITNLAEYQRGSDPSNANDPQLLFVVSALTGSDSTGTGTRGNPWASIDFALDQAALQATEAFPARLIILGGIYTETVTLRPFINVSGESVSGPSGAIQPVIVGSVIAVNDADLAFVSIQGGDSTGLLLDATGEDGTGVDATFTGLNLTLGTTGMRTGGSNAAKTIIESCRFNNLQVGLDVLGAIPVARRNFFSRISSVVPNGDVAAVIIEANSTVFAVNGSFGSTTDPTVGFNQFNLSNIAGPAIINERDTELKAENNDWKTSNADEIAAAIVGPVDFDPFLSPGSAVLASAVFCTVIDAATQVRIEDASVQLFVSGYSPVTANTNGVYAFPAVSDGSYQVTVAADGFENQTEPVFVKANQIAGVVVALGVPAPPAPGGCNNASPAKVAQTTGDLLVTGMALVALLAAGLYTRRAL